ncbi:hypothetical protein MN116_004491 [Schistosoma mekongi]|uniref:BZIP domain-containing protein n=1 Tax=Schistosoma mekongi TaxID=38744 RepID=A0AAE1ZGT6_SCHME|nr:hypothetical protein MN116_004491 [Schistosoma mekongi]
MTLSYSLDLNWVKPIITALSMSANSSILNLTSELSHSISSSSQNITSTYSYPQITTTKPRASSCFPLGRQLDIVTSSSSSLLSSDTYPKTSQDDDEDKPLDLTLKSATLTKSNELIKSKLGSKDSKISSRRKSNRTRRQVQSINEKTPTSEKLRESNHKSRIDHQSESNSPSTSTINGMELCSNNWIADIPDLLQLNESNQKRQKSTTMTTANRRPFKTFGNTVPSISRGLLLKSSTLIDPLLLASSIENDNEKDGSKSVEHVEHKIITPPASPTLTNPIPMASEKNSSQKPMIKTKPRRSQSASAIPPSSQTEKNNDSNQQTTVVDTLSTTKSLETLCKIDKNIDLPTITSISSTPSCYSSYSELIDTNNSTNTTDCNPRMRRFPEMTPSEVKDKAYWEKRVKNNEAARRSRRARKTKELSLKKYADNLEKVNMKLIEEIELLKAEIVHLKAEKEAEKLNCK